MCLCNRVRDLKTAVFLSILLALTVPTNAAGILRITEAMSNGDIADWFEVTNFGDTAVNITGYKMDDNSYGVPSTAQIALNGITSIAPGESVVFVEGGATTYTTIVATFKTNWALGSQTQVGYYMGSGVGLSSGGDGVTLFDALGNEISGAANSSYSAGLIRVSFGAASTSYSFRWSYTPAGEFSGSMETSSFGDIQGAFTSANGCTGSPGRIVRSAALQFTSQPPAYAKVGSALSYTFTYQTSNPSEVAGVTAPIKPSWLTLGGGMSGSQIFGTPTISDVGPNNLVTLRLVGTNKVVTNNITNNVPTKVDQTFAVTVFPSSSPVIVNEYNAVSSGNVLDTSKQSGRPGTDSRLGVVAGNGGNWLELAVVGNGVAGSTVDMRGWRIEISDNGSIGTRVTDTLVLSQTSYWAAVPVGTILTFTENNAVAGGFDTALNADDHRATGGWVWSNVWMGDTTLISNRTWADGVSISTLGQDQTQITLKNASGTILQGPCGEGISPAGDGLVTSKKVFALQGNPAPGVVPYDPAYVDSMQSTFGKPNLIVNKTTGRAIGIQSFSGKVEPIFTVLPGTTAIVGQLYGGSDIFQNNIELYSANFDDMQFSVRKKGGAPLPAWLTYQQDYEFVNLAGTPGAGDVGILELELVAKIASTGAETVQPLTIQVLSAISPVLLNEYNAVISGSTIGDGLGADSFFGNLADANGGPWFELVVVGDGTGNTIDMRGWSIDIDDSAGLPFTTDETLVLSEDSYWAAIPVGTILTFTELTSVQGGLDTWINKTSRLGQSSLPYLWSNIHIGDPYYINQTTSTTGGKLAISSSNTQFRIRKKDGTVVAGPCGEGLKTLPGVSSTEVFRLTSEPSSIVNPLDAGYVDGTQSTFGSPNLNQTFAAFQISNSAPTIVNQPTKYAVEGQVYTWTATTADAEGNSVTLAKVSGPSWLSVSGKTLSGTAPQGSAGFYDIELSANDGSITTPLKFRLTVFNDNPSMILNEYNAVDNSGATLTYLNGGTQALDSAGGTASDVHFGRVAGNGGDWVEFVVTGNGSAGTTDLRGYTIEIDEGASSGYFAAKVKIKLSQDAFWAAVPNGTILTFTESNTSQGGMDTNLTAANNSTTTGSRWANVWIGDSNLITYTDLLTNGYSITTGVVSGISIDDTETQFRILNSSGYPVFGPCGEGIAPLNKISNTDVLELEGNPTASVLPTDRSDDTVTPPKNGYDNSTKDSTFGAPNQWHYGSGGDLTTQDFTPYKSSSSSSGTSFSSWASAAGQGSLSMTSDTDGNGYAALLDFVFGASTPGSLAPAYKPTSSVVTSGSTKKLVLAYYQRQGTTGVTVQPQTNTGLTGTWVAVPAQDIVAVGSPISLGSYTVQKYEASVLIDSTIKQRFIRLQATAQ
jgi:Lamin Tail Domain